MAITNWKEVIPTGWVELNDVKGAIDAATYEELLHVWQKLPNDSPIKNPQYAVSVYYMKSMKSKAATAGIDLTQRPAGCTMVTTGRET